MLTGKKDQMRKTGGFIIKCDQIYLPTEGTKALSLIQACHLQKFGGRHPHQMPKPSQLAPFDRKEQQLSSELPLNIRAPHSISKAKHSQYCVAIPWGKLISAYIHDLILLITTQILSPQIRVGMQTGKLKALPSGSAPSSPQQSSSNEDCCAIVSLSEAL